MAGLTNYSQVAILNHLLRNTSLTSPTTVYLALHSADPGETGANELAAANGYARQAIAFDAPSSGVIASSADETFTASGADWSPATHWSLWDAASTGNCLAAGSLSATRTVADGESLVFLAGALTVTAGAGYSDYLDAAVLNHLFRNTALTSPTNVYLSLHSASPGTTGANELAASNGYSRNACAWDAPTSNEQVANSSSEVFTASGGDWSAATHWGVFDASTSGNFYFGFALSASKTIADGESGTFAAGALTVTAD